VPVERRVLVDFSVHCFQNIGCDLRRHVVQRSFDLLRRLTKKFYGLLWAVSPALTIRPHRGFLLSPAALEQITVGRKG
jgi:hypothetical protein